jgi:hypothetical protein
MSLRAPGVRVALTKGFIRANASSWRLMSTPEVAYVTGMSVIEPLEIF